MSAIGKFSKRFFRSHIFRTLIFSVLLFLTAFFPTVFAYNAIGADSRGFLIAAIVVACLAETLLFVLLSHYFVYTKIRFAARRLNAIPRDYAPIKIASKSIDDDVAEVLTAVNASADSYVQLAQARKAFVANASHELRTPLTSVQGFLQAVLDGTVPDNDREKYLKIALSETKRLNSLINTMLDLSRLDSGKNPIVPIKFDVNNIINEIIARFEPTIIKKAVQINVEFSDNSCYVYADKDKIVQVITNLVDNAIKYSPAYSRVVISTAVHDRKAHVSIRDFGYGISKKDQMLIWDAFYMTDKARTPVKSNGSGLGLSLVKKIIDEHGEAIWVDSNRGAGATFIFTLPLFDSSKHKAPTGKVITSFEEEYINNGEK